MWTSRTQNLFFPHTQGVQTERQCLPSIRHGTLFVKWGNDATINCTVQTVQLHMIHRPTQWFQCHGNFRPLTIRLPCQLVNTKQIWQSHFADGPRIHSGGNANRKPMNQCTKILHQCIGSKLVQKAIHMFGFLTAVWQFTQQRRMVSKNFKNTFPKLLSCNAITCIPNPCNVLLTRLRNWLLNTASFLHRIHHWCEIQMRLHMTDMTSLSWKSLQALWNIHTRFRFRFSTHLPRCTQRWWPLHWGT